jgi:hypothetical protein
MSRLIYVRQKDDTTWEYKLPDDGNVFSRDGTPLLASKGDTIHEIRRRFNADDDVRDETVRPKLVPTLTGEALYLAMWGNAGAKWESNEYQGIWNDMAANAVQRSFQTRVHPWLMECFGPMISGDKEERNHRFLEESLELVQACGCTKSEALQLVDYVYGRPVGEPNQEVGGVMVTLAALCLAHDMKMHECGEVELARVWTKVEQIRQKQATKPKNSPLPQYVCKADWQHEVGNMGEDLERCANCGTYRGNLCRRTSEGPAPAPVVFDYKKLLKAYLNHVREEEGTSFLYHRGILITALKDLTETETQELERLSDE